MVARDKEGRQDIYKFQALVQREIGRLAMMNLTDEIFEGLVDLLLIGDNGTFLNRVLASNRTKDILARIEDAERLPLPKKKEKKNAKHR